MAHDGLWEQLRGFSAVDTAERGKCRYLAEERRYVVRLLNSDYAVDLADGRIYPVEGGAGDAGFLEQLCILAYLIGAADIPLADKLVKAESLPEGQFFFRGIHSLPTGKLEDAFGEAPERLYEAMERFGAERREFGDASIRLYMLPRVPVTMVIWGGDDEFSARASMLFDATAAAQMPLDALLAAAGLAVKGVVGGCG